MTTKNELRAWLPPALLALVAWGVWATIPKLALQTLPPGSILFYDAIGNMAVMLPVLFWPGFRAAGTRHGVTITAAGAVLTVLALAAFFEALRHGSVAVIATMTAMYPAITALLARVVLGERLNRLQLVAMLLALVSIALLVA